MRKVSVLAALSMAAALTQVNDAEAAPSVSLSASSTSISSGTSVTFRWSSSGARSCTGSDGRTTQSIPLSGSASQRVYSSMTLTVRCLDAYRTATSKSVSVTVQTSSPTPTPSPSPTPTEPEPTPPATTSGWLGVPDPQFGITNTGSNVTNGCGIYNGTASNPVIVRVQTSGRCEVGGSYVIVENSDMRELRISGHHIAVRNSKIHNADNGNMVYVNPGARDIVIYKNEIAYNGTIPSSTDRHGIGLGRDTGRVWILDNHIHHNSGDGIQFCHSCMSNGPGPGAVYISGNRIHDDEENALDFKEFVGPVVVTRNELYGYQPSTNSNGDALRLNDEGRQGDIWIVANRCYDNRLDIQPHNSHGTSYILDNNCRVESGATYVASGTAAQKYYDLYRSRYGISIKP